MEPSEKEINKRLEIIKSWLGKPFNLALVCILLLAIFIRIYYFSFTKDQTLWWDALSYASIAKTSFLSGVPLETYSIQTFFEIILRPPMLPFLWSILMKIGFSEVPSKILLQLIPSVLSVFLVYTIGKEQYNTKVALIASFVLATAWMHIFYSLRMLTSIPALFLLLLSILFFLKSSDELKLKYFAASIFFLSIATLTRYPFGLAGIAYLIFLGITQKTKFLKRKSFWIGGLIGIIPILIFLMFNFATFSHIFPSITAYQTSAEQEHREFAFFTYNFISHILKYPFYLFFILGTVLMLIELILGYDQIHKSKKLKFHLLNVLLLGINLGFHIFWIKASEDRYLFFNMTALIFPVAIGLMYVHDFISKKGNKSIALVFLLVLLGWGAYNNYTFGDDLIKNRADSFSQMKNAFLWIRDNTPEDSIILGERVDFYTIYYADRIPHSWPNRNAYIDIYPDIVPKSWLENENKIEDDYEIEADYIVVDAFHWNPTYPREYLAGIEENIELVYAEFAGPGQENPLVLVYKYNKPGPSMSEGILEIP